MSKSIQVVIMAGGTGTRFWPHSREAKPKQFLDVVGTGRSLLQMTFDRFIKITSAENIWIVSNEKYESLIKEQLPELESDQILLEPEKRNTAPCIAYASYKILKKDPNAVMIVTPADHVIFKESEFQAVAKTAIDDAAENDHLITIGIRPHRPETGYGYIQYLDESKGGVHPVKTFTEKPQLDLALKFLESGDFLWNAGIFIWSIHSIVAAFEKYDEEMASDFAAGLNLFYSEEEKAFIRKTYSQCKSISIDYAIMEKAENVYVVPGDFGWSDLGSWNAVHELREKDEHGNVIEGSTLTYSSHNNYIKGSGKKLIVAHGVDDFLIADFDDVLLICKKGDSTVFKQFIADTKAKMGEDYI